MIRQAPATKTYDVVHLGNLCLDIIVQVDALPPADPGAGGTPRFRPLLPDVCTQMTAKYRHRILFASWVTIAAHLRHGTDI